MSSFRRLHLELLLQVALDRSLENVTSEIDFDQDDDTLTLFEVRPVVLAAGATATEVVLPTGSSAARVVVVYDVDGSSGINVMLGGAGVDPILVKPPTGSDRVGMMVLTTDSASVHVSNPSATAEVRATLLIGCEE